MLEPKILSAITLANDAWTLIDLSNLASSSILIQCRSAIDVYIAESDNPSDAYFTIKSGGGLSFDLDGTALGSAFKKLYAKAASGTPKLEVFRLK